MRADDTILLVDDDVVDTMTVQRAFRHLGITSKLLTAQNGEDALATLAEETPALILLDLNMPVMGGREFLERIKAEPSWRSIPVVVLTTSGEDEDKRACFDLSAAGYMVKPVGFQQFADLLRAVDRYWSLSERP